MQSYPFTSQVTYDENGLPRYDRAIGSDFLRQVFAQYFSDGVFYEPASALQVTVDTGMNVKVLPGVCHIRGAMGIEDSARVLAVQASEALDRIDTVVARLDLSLAVRSIDLYVVKGAPAETPAAPALTRNNTVWELGLADLFVAKNTTAISQQRITDTRLDSARCGQVMVPLATPDFGPYFAQLQAAIAAQDENAAEQLAIWQADFTAWFERMKGQLSEDAAGHLQNQVDAISRPYKITLLADGWVDQLGGYSQGVQCDGIRTSYILEEPKIKLSANGEVNRERCEALNTLCEPGYTIRIENGWLYFWIPGTPPSIDLTVYMRRFTVDEEVTS